MKISCIFLFYAFLLFGHFELCSYERPSAIDPITWQALNPYFLPEDHPIKSTLDTLFSSKSVMTSKSTLKKAKFKIISSGRPIRALVIKHKKLKGYLLKAFVEEQPVTQEWVNWCKRVDGSNYVRQAIYEYGYQDIMCVPHKWIYPLPVVKSNTKDKRGQTKFFILVVEKMNIQKQEKNVAFWRSIAVKPALIDALYTMLQGVGLYDSVYTHNVPFTRDRKIAFVDTEHFHEWPVPFHKFNTHLSPAMQKYWKQKTGQ